ncbi:MAG: hypothetical protein WCD12_21040 [Candidatus Binatus sp.]|uniref:hypothetical protein n=1 Tax=Candidatus Binatus sp. TaxID=2811406 RepID=UPI003C7963E9
MRTDKLPRYSGTAVDHAQPVMAVTGTDVEMSLSNVSFQIYPLMASMARLTQFCDLYLNFTHEQDRPPFFFRPALPYVLLQIIDYGSMAIEWQNMGWFGARELCFTIPLECYRRNGNELVFMDWATISPFIFADNPLSVRNGREVYGWPKVAMRMDSLTPSLDPLDLDLVIRLSLEVPGPRGARETDKFVPFLDVVREPAPFQSMRRAGSDFVTAVPNAIARSMSFMSDAARSFADLGAYRYQEFGDLGYLQAASDLGFQNLRALLPRVIGDPQIDPFPQALGYEGNAINLKQFRDAEDPDSACYQAVTLSKMTMERINDAGLMLDLRSGDPLSGRFLLRLFRYATQPIVENLGLEVAGRASVGDWDVTLLEPKMPFWMSADLSYGQGDTLCWRSRCSGWSEEIPLSAPKAGPGQTRIPYIPLGSGALQEITGPFTFPTLTIRVLPMIANQRKLFDYCQEYLTNEVLDGIPYRLEPWGSYAYLLAASYDGLTAQLNSAGLVTDREVAIVIPVKLYHGKDLVSVALLPAFTFAGSQVSAITDHEVYGRPTLLSELKSPPTNWMDPDSKPEQLLQPLLEIWTDLIPSDYVGAEAVSRAVLEIGRGQCPPASATESRSLWDWAHTLLRDYRRKAETAGADSASLEIVKSAMFAVLFFNIPIFSVALKEFMDAGDLDKACLQSLVQVSRSIESVQGIGEFEHPLHVLIPKYDTLPIVDALGLEVKWTKSVWDPEIGNVPTEVIEPIRPFWIRVAMAGTDSKNLCLRAGTEENWHTNDDCSKVPTPPRFGDKQRRSLFGPGLSRCFKEDKKQQAVHLVAEEWLRGLLADELHQFRQRLGNNALQKHLGSLNLRFRVPSNKTGATPDDSWTTFVNSFRMEELLQTIDLLEKSFTDLKVASNRCTRRDLADAIEKIDPQTAVEDILKEDWIKPSDQDLSGGAEDASPHPIELVHYAKPPLPEFRIRRESAGSWFKLGKTDWTGRDASKDPHWYWERIRG